MTKVIGCQLCGRTGTRGFRFIPPLTYASTHGPFEVPGFYECVGKVACQRRQYYGIPAATRAARRIANEIG